MHYINEPLKNKVLSELDKTSFYNYFIDINIIRTKGETFEERFADIISDPNNLLIPRVDNAGFRENGITIMHNGVKVLSYGYYNEFSKILEINKGCHEPAEERMFREVLNFIPQNGIMIELGSYWAFYSIWFAKQIKNSKIFCIEPNISNLAIGKKNFELNHFDAEFINAFVNENDFRVSNFVKERNIEYIDILHSDIQGYEIYLMNDIENLLLQNKIGYLFISTHSNKIHNDCINMIKKCNYRIVANADFESETFCYDGIIVASRGFDLNIPYIFLGNRSKSRNIWDF
jgi:hypothetical protein